MADKKRNLIVSSCQWTATYRFSCSLYIPECVGRCMQKGWIQTPRSIDEIILVLKRNDSKIQWCRRRNAHDLCQLVSHLYFLWCRMSMRDFAVWNTYSRLFTSMHEDLIISGKNGFVTRLPCSGMSFVFFDFLFVIELPEESIIMDSANATL